MRLSLISVVIAIALQLVACGDVYNNPYTSVSDDKIIYYSHFQEPPKHLDPAISYASDESLFISQIYEPPLGYHFLKRPYVLKTMAASEVPEITPLNADMEKVEEGSDQIAFTRFTIRIEPELRYQPHPAFAKKSDGSPLYIFENAASSENFKVIADFPETSSRLVHANDFIYQIKRLADPKNKSPMLGFMAQYIVGMREFSQQLGKIERNGWVNLDNHDMEGLEVIDDNTYSILINGSYPQFTYWLALHFFAPVPPEVDQFFHNPGFKEKNLTLDWYPVGTGAFMMTKNDPNSQIVLERNPNFRLEYYPKEGEEGDRELGYLEDAGKQIPFVDKAIFSLEKELLPMWTKFLQGYYDRSGEGHSNTHKFFDQAFVIGPNGLEMSEEMKSHDLTVTTESKPGTHYYGFNMLDPVLGGYTEERRKLRQALSIAFNIEDEIDIFHKGTSLPAHSPIPPGIPGYLEGEEGINPYVYDWVDGAPKRKPIEHAKKLLAEAGYPNGREAKTGKPLTIYLDVQARATTPDKQDWQRQQFEKLGVQLEFRSTDWNRFREKLLTGNTQIYTHGWLADYPDPENFLFLLYSPESPLICKCDGANNSNYANDEYDALFEKMRVMEPSPEREAIVAQMLDILRRDAVWMTGYHPLDNYLNNPWLFNAKRHGISKTFLKYVRVDSELRRQKRADWNQPVIWPVVTLGIFVILLFIPAVRAYRRRQNMTIH